MKRLNQAGDTIVEVLIAIAIVAAVLTGAYVTTNRSVRAGRAAQERGEALKVAETQAERLKFYRLNQSLAASRSINIDKNTLFCLTDTQQWDVVAAAVSNDTNCTFNTRYVATVSKDSSSKLYTIRIMWNNITGNTTVVNGQSYLGFDELKLFYRVE